MTIGLTKRAVGVFSTYREAEAALRELKTSGFAMNKVSVISKNADDNQNLSGMGVTDKPKENQVAGGAKAGAVAGATTGGLIGLIGSLTAFTIPGIGPILASGALATILADTLIGGAIGAATGGLVGALVGLGIPEDRARVYNDRVSRGEYLVVVEGSQDDLQRAQTILHRGGIQEWGVYDASHEHNRVTGANRRAVGVFATRAETEEALQELRRADFPMHKISVIARDADKHDDIAGVDVKDPVGNKADEGAATGAATGGALGTLTGLLVGLGALAIPGIGPIMLAGATATTLATTLAGTAIGAAAGGLLGGLVGLGIPEDRARVYNERVSRGEYLVLVDGSDDDIHRAETVLHSRGIQEWGVYNQPVEKTTHTTHTTTNATTGTPGVPFPETVHDRTPLH